MRSSKRARGRSDVDLSQFPDPRAGEMLTRWDMISAAPDVMVTNYSMLNTMMMRHIEESIFEQTASWLASGEDNVFTLVVDELHLYRGTQGSEVAMILRALFRRLGLSADSPQLRIIATSASSQTLMTVISIFSSSLGSTPRVSQSSQVSRSLFLLRPH